jgi:NDP-sugar pyrophosphorylase family protein
VVLASGPGTRLGTLGARMPKTMLPDLREPQWNDLRFVLTGQQGTRADLLDCLRHVDTDAFVVWNGDTVVDLDVAALLTASARDPAGGVIVLTRRTGVPNEGAFFVAGDGRVLASLEAVPTPAIPSTFAWRGSSAGVLLLRKSLLSPFHSPLQRSLEKSILPSLIATRQLRAFDNGERYFLDFGTWKGFDQLRRDPPRHL